MFAKKKTQPTTTTTKNETPDYIVRLREEIREVNDRLHKISEFETTKTFKKLSAYQKDLLERLQAGRSDGGYRYRICGGCCLDNVPCPAQVGGDGKEED